MLHDVSLHVDDGSLCAVIGPSGAGKSTLLRVAAGLVAHEGSVFVDDIDVTRLPPHRRGVAMLFQEPRLFDSMSVLDNVAYADRIRRVPRTIRRKKAAALLDEVGLAARADERPAGLSGGERQRIALARALNASPRVLLLDEPLTALDAPRRAELRAVIDSVRRSRHLSTLYVSHDLADAVALADDLAVMIDGRIAQHDAPHAVLDRPASPAVARLTGNPNVLVDGSITFTIRPEHVALNGAGSPARVRHVDHRVTHDVVHLDSPWGVLHAVCAPGSGGATGDVVCVSLPAARTWSFPPGSPAERIGETRERSL
ncbi:MAG TPA: ABC transporter ATP-binding protein [Acidimicrobiales bacterium]|nr:ABC transporter ATP-binding protein [Acidimicrobiales bacterium]